MSPGNLSCKKDKIVFFLDFVKNKESFALIFLKIVRLQKYHSFFMSFCKNAKKQMDISIYRIIGL